MQHRIRIDKSLITVTQDEVVNLVLELQAPPAQAVERPPLDVVLVLDRSGSMAGDPLDAVIAASRRLLRLAGPDDRIGVVVFDDTADVVVPLGRPDVDAADRALARVGVGGSTNLSGGWLKAVEMLTADRRDAALRRVVVLTDGQANVGIVDPSQLARMVAGGQGHGVTTSLIGFAEHYDEELLATLADAGHGNDYWCAGADQAAGVFAAEFAGLASVVAQNVSIEIATTTGVAAFDVLNDFPCVPLDDQRVQVSLGDAYGDEVRRVAVQFNLRPQPAIGPIDVAVLTLRWAATGDDVSLHSVEVPVVVRRGETHEVDTLADPTVTAEVTTLVAERRREEARRLADDGDYGSAADSMRLGARLMASTAPDLAAEMLRDADALEDGLWSQRDSKKHFSQRRTRQTGRSRRFDQ